MKTQKNLVVLAIVFMVAFGVVSSVPSAKPVSETPQVQWQQSLGGAFGRSVIQTSDGGYLILGADRSTGYDASQSPSLVSLTSLLIRTDNQGNPLWQNDLRFAESETNFNFVIPTISGIPTTFGIALAGSSSNDTRLVSLDLGGNLQWTQILNGTYDGIVRSLIQTSDGGFALVGTYYRSSPGGNQIWCTKTDEFGNQTWNETIGSVGESASAILESNDGGYAIIGTKTIPGSSRGLLEITKIDTTGVVEWTKTYAAPVQGDVGWAASANDGIATQDGGYLIAGMLSSPNSQNGPTYAWLVKTDSLGNLAWNKTVGNNNSHISSILQAIDGGYTFSGTLGQDAWIAKTDSIGNMEWNSTYPGVSIITPGKSIVQTNDTGYAVVGAADNGIWLAKIAPESITPSSNGTTVVVRATAGGTTDPVPGTYTCNASTQVSFLAKPDVGYIFEKWVSGTQEFELNPLVFVAENGTYNLEAVFVVSNQSSSQSISSKITSFFFSPQGAAVVLAIALSFVVISAVIFQKRRTKKNRELRR